MFSILIPVFIISLCCCNFCDAKISPFSRLNTITTRYQQKQKWQHLLDVDDISRVKGGSRLIQKSDRNQNNKKNIINNKNMKSVNIRNRNMNKKSTIRRSVVVDNKRKFKNDWKFQLRSFFNTIFDPSYASASSLNSGVHGR